MKSRQLFFENLLAQNALGGIPAGYNFADKTLYQIFSDLFSGGITYTQINLEPNTGLEFNLASNLQTKYNTLIADATPSQTINLLTSKTAAVWKTKTIVQVLDEILFPATLPTYTPTTIGLTHSLTLPYYEVGSSQTNNLILTAIQNNAGDYSNLSILRDSSVIESDDTPSFTGTINKTYTLQYSDTISVDPGTTTWTGNGDYASGIVKTNSDGTPDTRTPQVRNPNAPQRFEDNFDSNDVSINGIYPYYYGFILSPTKPTAAEIATLVNNYSGQTNQIRRTLKPLTNTEDVFFNAENPCWMWIAHVGTPKTNYITQNQSTPTDITGTNLFNSNQITAFTETNNYWTDVDFNLYIASSKSDTAGNYWFRFR
jgi:hypothetical protein